MSGTLILAVTHLPRIMCFRFVVQQEELVAVHEENTRLKRQLAEGRQQCGETQVGR